MNVDTTPIYHDLQSLSALRQRASSDPNAAIEEVVCGLFRSQNNALRNFAVLPAVVVDDLVLQDLGKPGAFARPAGVPTP